MIFSTSINPSQAHLFLSFQFFLPLLSLMVWGSNHLVHHPMSSPCPHSSPRPLSLQVYLYVVPQPCCWCSPNPIPLSFNSSFCCFVLIRSVLDLLHEPLLYIQKRTRTTTATLMTPIIVPRHEVGELRNAAVRLSVCPSVRPSVHLSVRLSFRPSHTCSL